MDPDSCVCVCVCGFPPEAVLHQAPPGVYSVYSSAPQPAFITLSPIPGQGHGQGVGALEVSEVRDPPPCLLTAQSAFTFFPLVKQTRTDGVHSHFHGGV